MDQRTTTLDLARKGPSATEIHVDLAATLGPESVNYPSVKHYLHQVKFPTSKPNIIIAEPEPELDDSDEAISLGLSEQAFASVRKVTQFMHLSRSTVCKRLTQTLSFRVRHF
jgi:hypothetical protein